MVVVVGVVVVVVVVVVVMSSSSCRRRRRRRRSRSRCSRRSRSRRRCILAFVTKLSECTVEGVQFGVRSESKPCNARLGPSLVMPAAISELGPRSPRKSPLNPRTLITQKEYRQHSSRIYVEAQGLSPSRILDSGSQMQSLECDVM